MIFSARRAVYSGGPHTYRQEWLIAVARYEFPPMHPGRILHNQR